MNNLLSLLLGLFSWGLGVLGLIRPGLRWPGGMSLLCCCGALALQLAQLRRLTALGDWAALLDTADGVLTAALVLLSVTAGLYLAALCRPGKKTAP